MVKFFSTTWAYRYDWPTVTQAVWQKYPNPFASHVLSSDVIDRTVDPISGAMTTTRIFLKSGYIPKWGRSLLNVPEAFILEQSTVDPKSRTMVTTTRNLSHTKLMLVQETQTFQLHPERNDWTEVRVDVQIISNTGWAPIKSKIEGFGLLKFKDNTVRSSKGLLHVVDRLAHGVKN
ncbi:PRELI-like family-domain-containing protein [Phlyctochytrium arcticum]|nr:PRELI-like family-domain-containing protein [Phlyctochytrium arcticum]